MSFTYANRKRSAQTPPNPVEQSSGPDYQALMTGAARPTAAQKGRPIDLDAAMKAKMERAFGTCPR